MRLITDFLAWCWYQWPDQIGFAAVIGVGVVGGVSFLHGVGLETLVEQGVLNSPRLADGIDWFDTITVTVLFAAGGALTSLATVGVTVCLIAIGFTCAEHIPRITRELTQDFQDFRHDQELERQRILLADDEDALLRAGALSPADLQECQGGLSEPED